MNFYTNLFTTSKPKNFEEVIDVIPKVVTAEMNATLTCDFTTMEVKIALKKMASLQVPSPNGMLPLFHQNYWSLLGNDVHNLFCTI